MPKHVPPKIFPGRLHQSNNGALDWGSQNLIAFGSHSYVVVVEPQSLNIVQTLDEHRAHISAVKWCNEPLHNDIDKPYKLKLASGDMIGNIIIWNVLEAGIASTLVHDMKPILDLMWHPKDHSLLLSLHGPTSMILWNIFTGMKQWKVDLAEPLSWFTGNPFDVQHLALASTSGMIWFIRDLKTDAPPSAVEHTYSVTSNRSARGGSDFQQMLFSPHTRNIMYFLLSRELLVFDLTIHQAIGSIALDRSRSSFVRMVLCKDIPDLLLFLHEDGSLSAWWKKEGEFRFSLKGVSESVRFAKQPKKKGVTTVAFANGPQRQHQIFALSSDGTTFMWDYFRELSKPRFCITGLVENITSPISSLNVSPFPSESETLIALGTYHGTIQVLDILHSIAKAEFVLWTQAVRGVQWISPTSILAFNCEEIGKLEYRNRLMVVNVQTGTQREIRKMTTPENSFIRGVRISSSRQYFIVLLKDRPFELWDLKTLTLLRTMKPFAQVTALEWSPLPESESPFDPPPEKTKEAFVFTLPDGSLRHYILDNHSITATDIQADLGMGIISSLAWKGDLLVSGDTAGTINVFNLVTRKSQTFATNKGLVRRIRFAPGMRSQMVMVLFNEGDFGIWDLDHNLRVSISSYLRGRDLKAVDCDWINESVPVVATSDGAVRVLDRSLSISNSTLLPTSLSKPICTPFLLPSHQALQLKVLLQHYAGPLKRSFDSVKKGPLSKESLEMKRPSSEEQLLEFVDSDFLQSLHSGSPAERCKQIAQFFGQEEEIMFWQLALWALKKYPPSGKSEVKKEESKEEEPDDVEESATVTIVSPSIPNPNQPSLPRLPIYFDLLLDSETIRQTEVERVTIQEKKRTPGSHDLAKKVIEFHLLLGQKDKGVELLLNTPSDNPNFFKDALKAAVVAASISPDSFKNTMKLIATSLIANGTVDEGVQLLCLIDKGVDACRYLQTYDRWADAAWLAKISLPEPETASIYRRWAQHLNQTNQKMKAILVLLTLGDFHQVMQLLYESQHYDLASHFAAACNLSVEMGSLSKSSEGVKGELPLEQLLQSIHLEYGFYLQRLGNTPAAEFYWKKAGSEGNNAIEKVQSGRRGTFLRNTQ